jgi:hypothetical protein
VLSARAAAVRARRRHHRVGISYLGRKEGRKEGEGAAGVSRKEGRGEGRVFERDLRPEDAWVTGVGGRLAAVLFIADERARGDACPSHSSAAASAADSAAA